MHAGFGHLHLFHQRWDLSIPHVPRSLVKHPAPIKCFALELFSFHVVLLLDYNPTAASYPSLCTPVASVSIHPAQVQLHVMFFVICHMQLLD